MKTTVMEERTYANTQQQIMSWDFQDQRHKTFSREVQNNSTDVIWPLAIFHRIQTGGPNVLFVLQHSFPPDDSKEIW